jgi:lysophospholipase L1-like esterase
MKIITFGDSWAAGHGLGIGEKNFTDFLSLYLNCDYKNFAQRGASLGHILHDFTKEIKDITKDDLIVIITPPDVRWYTESSGRNFSTIFIGDKNYKSFVRDKSKYWFKYHHSLFIYTMYSICKDIKCNFILAHNYGSLDIIYPFYNLIQDEIFLNKSKSLTSLLGGRDYNNYNLRHDGPPGSLKGENFIDGDTHPNEKGHKIIADLLLKKYNEKL